MKVRPIDANKLLRVLNSNFGHTGGAAVMKQLIEAQPTLTKPNEPLTMKELREMNGQPVWLAEEKVWALLQVWDDDNIDAVFSMPIGCFHAKPIIGTKIYRHPLPEPPEED
ncbi:Uncharacterised protein [uncultured Ruminococcus sp.]|nr:Uncharacterised protein [uncultured Ruminococcus sp.]